VLTNKQTDKQMPLETSTSLRCATPVGNNSCHEWKSCNWWMQFVLSMMWSIILAHWRLLVMIPLS